MLAVNGDRRRAIVDARRHESREADDDAENDRLHAASETANFLPIFATRQQTKTR